MVIYYLTCADTDEADKIGIALLESRLIVCARQSKVNSSYWWDGKINHEDEILLTMESLEEKFDDIEKVVNEIHSYDQPVLNTIPVLKTTPGVQDWLNENIL